MAGPAIRCLELAKQLKSEFEVSVFSPNRSDLAVDDPVLSGLTLHSGLSKSALYSLAEKFDLLFIQANVLKTYPKLAKLNKYLVVDLYDPYLLAILAQFDPSSHSIGASYNMMHKVLEKHMSLLDFGICASERQRDYWLGRFCQLGRLDPQMYAFDSSFRKLIDVVPFGLSAEFPKQKTQKGPIKGVVPGINSDDFLLIWGGGIWQWFDPCTVIEAVFQAAKKNPKVKLFFMGMQSPNPQVPMMGMAKKAYQLAGDLKILDKHVFFSKQWIAYDQRISYLQDADLAVSAHFDLIETRFSFRTRMLDYLYVALPTLSTGGDHLSQMIEKYGAGLSLDYLSVQAWSEAILDLSADKSKLMQMSEGARLLSREFTWQNAAKPLIEYCRSPYKSPGFKQVQSPSLVQRAQAVYERGGADLVIRRSKEIIKDIVRK
jgi:glycosyltransferase involved in cell wall biosynthesis